MGAKCHFHDSSFSQKFFRHCKQYDKSHNCVRMRENHRCVNRNLRSNGCLMSILDNSNLILGPLGRSGPCQIRDIIVWETGVATGGCCCSGAIACVLTFTGGLSVQPPPVIRGHCYNRLASVPIHQPFLRTISVFFPKDYINLKVTKLLIG